MPCQRRRDRSQGGAGRPNPSIAQSPADQHDRWIVSAQPRAKSGRGFGSSLVRRSRSPPAGLRAPLSATLSCSASSPAGRRCPASRANAPGRRGSDHPAIAGDAQTNRHSAPRRLRSRPGTWGVVGDAPVALRLLVVLITITVGSSVASASLDRSAKGHWHLHMHAVLDFGEMIDATAPGLGGA